MATNIPIDLDGDCCLTALFELPGVKELSLDSNQLGGSYQSGRFGTQVELTDACAVRYKWTEEE